MLTAEKWKWLTSRWFLYPFLNELWSSETISENKNNQIYIHIYAKKPKTGVMRLFIWQQCINIILFPWESVLMQVVFCCLYPACFSLHGSNLGQICLFLFLFFFFTCSTPTYRSFRKHEVLKFQTDEMILLLLCLWRDEFRLRVPYC